MAGNCNGAYLLAMFCVIIGIVGTNGDEGGGGFIGVCVVDGGVEKLLCEVEEELGECGAER